MPQGGLLVVDAAEVDGAQLAFLEVLLGRHVVRCAAVLETALHDALVFARRLDHLLAFPAVVCGRFLDVDVLAGLAGPDGRQGMPVIGSGRDDGVDRLVVQGLAEILDDLGWFSLQSLDQAGLRLSARRVRITGIGVLTIIALQKSFDQSSAASTAADGGQHDLVVGWGRACRPSVARGS